MAILTLTDTEVVEVRLQLGARLTASDLSDEQIRSTSVLGAATDYVFEKLREGLNEDALVDEERVIAERFRDEQPEDISNFVNVVLKPPQRQQLRLGVIYRAAGIAAPMVERYETENAAGISQRVAEPRWQSLQRSLFSRADEQIQLVRKAFPDDAFQTEAQRVLPKYKLFTLGGC